MFRIWTRAAAAICTALVLVACGGSNKNENRIKPVQATLNIVPYTGVPAPAVFLEKGATTGDLVTVDVRLHPSGPSIDFDAYSLEFHYDPTRVNVGNVFDVNPAVLGQCCFAGSSTCSPCDPLCSLNSDANTTGVLVIGVAALPTCPTASVGADTTLLSLAFVAATTIDGPPDPPKDPDQAPGRIRLISGAGHGDCEILNGAADLGIDCVDGDAYLTAAR